MTPLESFRVVILRISEQRIDVGIADLLDLIAQKEFSKINGGDEICLK